VLGSRRDIPTVDYYFGKEDPYRIPLYKDWTYGLQPAPKTPKARKTEYWNLGDAVRMSGVLSEAYGYGMHPGYNVGCASCCSSGHGKTIRSSAVAAINLDRKLELVGKPSKEELAEYVKQIEEEGGNYLAHVPDFPRKYPILTMGL
jgi:hypothetical protein